MKVWLDGEICDGPALIPVTDHGLLYGDGVFEGLRVYGGRVFCLTAHLERLSASARAIGLEVPGGIEVLKRIVLDTVQALGLPDAYVRLIVTRGDGPLGVDPTRCSSPRTICIADRLEIYPEHTMERGLDLITSSLRRPDPDMLDPRVKSLNYLNNVLAKREARLRGADEALLLNRSGHIAEAAVANVFCVKNHVLRTPAPEDGALDGITADTILQLAQALAIPVERTALAPYDLLSCDEAFLTGSGTGVVPVRSLDGSSIPGEVPGPLTRKLMVAYEERTRSHVD